MLHFYLYKNFQKTIKKNKNCPINITEVNKCNANQGREARYRSYQGKISDNYTGRTHHRGF